MENIKRTSKDFMNSKEIIQYGSAVAMIVSGIILAFLSFFIKGDITDGVLWYISQALIYAGGIFGVSIYFRTRLGEFEHKVRMEWDDFRRKMEASSGG